MPCVTANPSPVPLPVILVVMFFQLIVLQQPLPNLAQLLSGVVLVVLGLTLFIQGLEMGLFPIGEAMAHALAFRGQCRDSSPRPEASVEALRKAFNIALQEQGRDPVEVIEQLATALPLH